MHSNAKRPRFLRKGEYLPLQGKQAERCIILKQDKKTKEWFVTYNKMKFNLKINPKDLFVLETLSNMKITQKIVKK